MTMFFARREIRVGLPDNNASMVFVVLAAR
jgi:hypothetical protein